MSKAKNWRTEYSVPRVIPTSGPVRVSTEKGDDEFKSRPVGFTAVWEEDEDVS